MQNNKVCGYTLLHPLGTGGMAEVWYAENKIHKPAAVKFLLPKFCSDSDVVNRFRAEAEVMVKLNHPNIRQVYDYDEVDGRPCIVMEYLEGSDFATRMKRGEQFTGEQLRKRWNQLAAALNYTHKHGVVHRDIKPSNIFVTTDGDVKLLDFGIAKVRDSIVSTHTGATMGTLMYMSPEQVRDSKHIDHKTDLYSLAVTFVHLLTGNAPYDRDNTDDFEIRLNIVQKPLDLSGLSAGWQNFLRPYLAKNPADRPALRELPVGDGHGGFVPPVFPASEETVVGDAAAATRVMDEETVAEGFYSKIIHVNGVSFKMVAVEGGTFWMGGDGSEATSCEKPVHKVKLDSFYLGETEVTQALWRAVMGLHPSDFKGDNLPVDNVSYIDIVEDFIPKLNRLTGKMFRLPTEAEWEYAARGGKKNNGYKYSGGNSIDEVAWYWDNSGGKTHIVKTKLANELGLYDMSGNVWEWCGDFFGDYSDSAQSNPRGGGVGFNRVLRGGSWYSRARDCRVSYRYIKYSDIRDDNIGFRLVLV